MRNLVVLVKHALGKDSMLGGSGDASPSFSFQALTYLPEQGTLMPGGSGDAISVHPDGEFYDGNVANETPSGSPGGRLQGGGGSGS